MSMKDLYIDEVAKIKAYKRLGRPLFMPHELVFLDYDRSLEPNALIDAFTMYSKDGNNLWLKTAIGENVEFLNSFIQGTIPKLEDLPGIELHNKYIELRLSQSNIESFKALNREILPNAEYIFINPGNLNFENLDLVQDLLNTLITSGFKIDFTHNHELYYQWDARTLNTSRGPQQVDIDLSNGCTHDCQFCGLYADSVIERQKSQNSGVLPEEVLNIQKAKIEEAKVFSILEQLPPTLERVILGGAGDPYTHGKINEVISHLRQRGVTVQIFTNFAYLSNKDIDKLHDLCLDDKESLSFIMNVSGATPETYVKTRPNQTPATFTKVTNSIKYASDLIKRDGKGLYMTLMSVTTSDNYHEMPSFISMSKSLGCDRVWIKPLEPHDEESFKILVKEEKSLDYAIKAKQSLYLADKLGIEIVEREILERIVTDFKEKLDEYESQKSLSIQIKELSAQCQWTMECLTSPELKPIRTYRLSYGNIFEVDPHNQSVYEIPDWKLRLDQSYWQEDFKKTNEDFSTEAGFSSDVFDSQPCYIGNNYMRIHVDGKTTPCCNLNLKIGDTNNSSLDTIWNGTEMNQFRAKMLSMNKMKYHRNEELYAICARCPHLKFNRLYHQYRIRNS